jgi:hypothetical protein
MYKYKNKSLISNIENEVIKDNTLLDLKDGNNSTI